MKIFKNVFRYENDIATLVRILSNNTFLKEYKFIFENEKNFIVMLKKDYKKVKETWEFFKSKQVHTFLKGLSLKVPYVRFTLIPWRDSTFKSINKFLNYGNTFDIKVFDEYNVGEFYISQNDKEFPFENDYNIRRKATLNEYDVYFVQDISFKNIEKEYTRGKYKTKIKLNERLYPLDLKKLFEFSKFNYINLMLLKLIYSFTDLKRTKTEYNALTDVINDFEKDMKTLDSFNKETYPNKKDNDLIWSSYSQVRGGDYDESYVKDYIRESLFVNHFFIPLKIKKLILSKSKKSILENAFPNFQSKSTVNRMFLAEGYTFLRDFGKSFENDSNKFSVAFHKAPRKHLSEKFKLYYLAEEFLLNKFKEKETKKSDFRWLIADYVYGCKLLGIDVDLTINSLKKLRKAHDDISIRVRNESTPEIVLPDNSILSENIFDKYTDNHLCIELIDTKERLVLEGANQSHCVANYAGKMNSGNTSIYSFLYESKRYTLEIIVENNKFKKAQLRGKRNALPPENLDLLITNEIEKINEVAFKPKPSL